MSIGIARYPDNGITVKELVKNADIAMYTVKSQGRNDFRFFNSTMDSGIIGGDYGRQVTGYCERIKRHE